MPNRQRTMHSFHTATGARLPANSALPPLRATEPERPAVGQSRDEWLRQTALEGMAQRQQVADARDRGVAAAFPRERRHDISCVPTPWGSAPQQDALRGVITSCDSDGRCSYGATHKWHSSHNHWSPALLSTTPAMLSFGEMSRRSAPPPTSANH